MENKVTNYLYAKYRSCHWLSCLQSPRSDVLGGWKRWRWLASQRKNARLIDPTVRIQGNINRLGECFDLGAGVSLDRGVTIWIGVDGSTGTILLSDRVYVGPYVYLGTLSHRLIVGEDTMIGAFSYLTTENHSTQRRDIPYRYQGYVGADIVIGKNVWIGAHVTILPGVTIGDHAIIGAGAVVTKDIPTGETWAGVPAKQIRENNKRQLTIDG